MKEKIGWGGAMRRLVEKLEEDKIKTGKIMKVNPAVANKMLKKITEEYEALKVKEAQSKDFLASLNENPDSIRPKYDFNKTQSEIYAYEEKIRKIKHALNKFNVNTLIPGFGITIDEMLVLITQLTKQKAKLGAMKDKLPKMREKVVGYGANGVIDYCYINYDIDEVHEEYQLVSEKLTKAQLALDNVNTTFTFEIDI